MTQSESDWCQYRRWCNRASLSLGLCIVFMILIPSISAAEDSWCQASYGVGAVFLLLAFVLMGRAILSLEVRQEETPTENHERS